MELVLKKTFSTKLRSATRQTVSKSLRPIRSIVTTLLIASLVVLAACTQRSGLPANDSNQYRDLCAAFYLGLAALQSGEDVHAKEGLEKSTQIAPGEPSAWADLGILQMRQQEFDAAFASVDTAHSLAPENSDIESLLGVIESHRGKVPEALAHFEKAVSLDGKNIKALYSLAAEKERQSEAGSERQATDALNQILKVQPANIAVLLDVARLAAKRNDVATLRQVVERLRPFSAGWPDRAKTQFAALQQQAEGSNGEGAAVQIQFLRNVLLRTPNYRQSLDQVKVSTTVVAEPFVKFLRLPSPSSLPAPADTKMSFEQQALPNIPAAGVTWTGAIVLDAQSDPSIIWTDANTLHIGSTATVALPKGNPALLARNAIVGADLDYDFKTDLVVATPDGLKIYQQLDPQHFKDITQDSKIPRAIAEGDYTGAWAFDIDLDGDLDIVLGVPQGEPIVLRNNGDRTFSVIHPFKGVDGLIQFASADIDADGVPDAAIIDRNGKLQVFSNKRLGQYSQREIPTSVSEHNIDLAAADINGDGLPDLVLLKSDFNIVRLSDSQNGGQWKSETLGRAIPAPNSAGQAHLILADLDNNGALDLIAGDQIFIGDGKQFAALPAKLTANAQFVVDSDKDGRLDIVGLVGAQNGGVQPVELTNHGSKTYYWQNVRTRAAKVSGDQRINSFGIGGEIEMRAELLTQKQIIDSPLLHFGLGDHPVAAFARIVWPNGLIQTEFDLKVNQTLVADQRLKGSCPMLFAWNGRDMQFVKDVAPMAGALGAHDISGEFAAISQSNEWFKLGPDQLKARAGFYDLRLTDEYWETYYMDHYALSAIDHPAGTEVFIDERVAEPPVARKVYVTNTPREFLSAKDERGGDVSSMVRNLDEAYLNTFELGEYQGLARDHWVELELPPDAPNSGPLYLLGSGWLHPWDDGILVAVNQGVHEKPKDLSIEVLDARGNWKTVRKNLGIPAGRLKTVVLDLTGIFQNGAPRKLRLRTNLEIYWDKLSWAAGLSENLAVAIPLPLASAELRYRGFSEMRPVTGLAPEIPLYDRLASTGGKWWSVEGYYTRYGDVLPLLNSTDDRIVICSSGDELRLKFHAAPPLKAGWSRDFVFAGDGWMKEGDYSFKHSATLLPLPSRAMKIYPSQLRPLEDDPVFRLHASDWQIYHTRYLTAKYFLSRFWEQ